MASHHIHLSSGHRGCTQAAKSHKLGQASPCRLELIRHADQLAATTTKLSAFASLAPHVICLTHVPAPNGLLRPHRQVRTPVWAPARRNFPLSSPLQSLSLDPNLGNPGDGLFKRLPASELHSDCKSQHRQLQASISKWQDPSKKPHVHLQCRQCQKTQTPLNSRTYTCNAGIAKKRRPPHWPVQCPAQAIPAMPRSLDTANARPPDRNACNANPPGKSAGLQSQSARPMASNTAWTCRAWLPTCTTFHEHALRHMSHVTYYPGERRPTQPTLNPRRSPAAE
jgi:hypothetical protein